MTHDLDRLIQDFADSRAALDARLADPDCDREAVLTGARTRIEAALAAAREARKEIARELQSVNSVARYFEPAGREPRTSKSLRG